MAEPKKHKAQVMVNREAHGGWFHGGRYYGNGTTDAELTDDEALALARRPGVIVLIGGKQVAKTPEAGGGAGIPVTVSEDEYAELQRLRADKSRQSAHTTPQTQTLQFEGRMSAGTAAQELLSRPAGGAATGADVPLQDSAILHGEPPPENPTANVKPLENTGKKK